MNRSPQSLNQYRDLVHAAALLILVPVVFYGGYRLVSSSTDTKPAPDNPFEQPVATAKRAAKSMLGGSGPSPGETWIPVLDRLKESLAKTNPANSQMMRRRNILIDHLDAIRQHCETHHEAVSSQIGDQSALGRMLIRLASEIDQLQHQSSQATITQDWEREFETIESDRLARQAISINIALERKIAPMRRTHATQLASVSRQNQELADELQRALDSIRKIERNTREQLARHRRSEAYARDKDEIARLLKPFTSPGYYQLRDTPEDWVKQSEAKPLSYRTLDRLGALSPNIDGVRALARIGGLTNFLHPKSARPMGAFPEHKAWSVERNIESIKRVQRLLKEHSVHLIEVGLLQP